MPTERKPRRKPDADVPVLPDGPPMPLTPDMPVTLTHTVGGLSVEVPPIVREELAEMWGYVPPDGGVYEAIPHPEDGKVGGGPLADVTEPEGAFTHTVEWAAPREVSITLPYDDTSYKVYAPGIGAPVFVWPPPLPERPTTCEEYAARILTEDPRTALALIDLVAAGKANLLRYGQGGPRRPIVDLRGNERGYRVPHENGYRARLGPVAFDGSAEDVDAFLLREAERIGMRFVP